MTPQPPVILLAFASEDPALRDLGTERRRVSSALDEAARDGRCELIVLPDALIEDVIKTFRDSRYQDRIAILHFAGHAGSYALAFESASGGQQLADADALAGFLSQRAGLKLVFLNACSTQSQAKALLEAGVPAIISTSQAIRDDVASEFAWQFYSELALGTPIGAAFSKARKATVLQKGQAPLRDLLTPADGDLPAEETDPWRLTPADGGISWEWNLLTAVDDNIFGARKRDRTVFLAICLLWLVTLGLVYKFVYVQLPSIPVVVAEAIKRALAPFANMGGQPASFMLTAVVVLLLLAFGSMPRLLRGTDRTSYPSPLVRYWVAWIDSLLAMLAPIVMFKQMARESLTLVLMTVVATLFVYFGVLEALASTTIIKFINHMRVTTDDKPCTLTSALIRGLWRFPELLLAPFSLSLMDRDSRRRRIGDRPARTIVSYLEAPDGREHAGLSARVLIVMSIIVFVALEYLVVQGLQRVIG